MADRREFEATPIFKILQQLIDIELDNLKDYVVETSTDLRAKQTKLEKKFNEAKKKAATKEDETDIHEYFENDSYRYFELFPAYTYNPILLALYGFFENWLKKLCEYDNRRGFSQIKVSDLAGYNDLEKSRRYFKLISGLDLSSIDEQWKKITEIQKIRNCIAHNNSNIFKDKGLPLEKQELYKIIKNDNRIKLDIKSGGFYINEKEFLIEVIGLFRQYLTTLTDQLSRRKAVARNTSMPYDNTAWGQEKVEQLLQDIIHGLELLDQNEKRTDKFKDSDLKANLKGHFSTMAWNLTKLYAFFCDGTWDTKDRDLIIKERSKGLSRLKKLYNK